MTDHGYHLAPATPEARPQPAREVAIGLSCPKCNATVQVQLGRLNERIRCKECGARFAMGRECEAPAAKPRHVVCPRCSESQQVTPAPGQRVVVCRKCQVGISLKPTRTAGAQALFSGIGGDVPRWFVLTMAASLLLLVGGFTWWVTTPALDPKLTETATRFTLQVLRGQTEDAQLLVTPNQGADFRQWLQIDVSRALESTSLQGDARLGIRLRDTRDGVVWVEAELAGVSQKRKVVLLEGWRPVLGGDWRFEAAQTVERTRTAAAPRRPDHVERGGGK